MVVRYGEDEHDCGVWARCNAEEDEREMEEYEAEILRLAECEGGYRDDCGVLDCSKGDDDSQWEYLEGEP